MRLKKLPAVLIALTSLAQVFNFHANGGKGKIRFIKISRRISNFLDRRNTRLAIMKSLNQVTGIGCEYRSHLLQLAVFSGKLREARKGK